MKKQIETEQKAAWQVFRGKIAGREALYEYRRTGEPNQLAFADICPEFRAELDKFSSGALVRKFKALDAQLRAALAERAEAGSRVIESELNASSLAGTSAFDDAMAAHNSAEDEHRRASKKVEILYSSAAATWDELKFALTTAGEQVSRAVHHTAQAEIRRIEEQIGEALTPLLEKLRVLTDIRTRSENHAFSIDQLQLSPPPRPAWEPESEPELMSHQPVTLAGAR